MYSQGFNEEFASCYDFIDFVRATGLQSPQVGIAFKSFKHFSWLYVNRCGLGALAECFEAWFGEPAQEQFDEPDRFFDPAEKY